MNSFRNLSTYFIACFFFFFFSTQCMKFKESSLDPNQPLSTLLLLQKLRHQSPQQLSSSGRSPVPTILCYFSAFDSFFNYSTGIVGWDLESQSPRFSHYPVVSSPGDYPLVGEDSVLLSTVHPSEDYAYLYFRDLDPDTGDLYHGLMTIDMKTGEVFSRQKYFIRDASSYLEEEGHSYPVGLFYSSTVHKVFLVTQPGTNEFLPSVFFLHIFDPDTLVREEKIEIDLGGFSFQNQVFSERAILDEDRKRILIPILRMNLNYNYDGFIHVVSIEPPYSSLFSDPNNPAPMEIFSDKDGYHFEQAFSPVFDRVGKQLIFFTYSSSNSNNLRFYFLNIENLQTTTIDSTHFFSPRDSFYRNYWNPRDRQIYVQPWISSNHNSFYRFGLDGSYQGYVETMAGWDSIATNETYFMFTNISEDSEKLYYFRQDANFGAMQFGLGYYLPSTETNSNPILAYELQDTSKNSLIPTGVNFME